MRREQDDAKTLKEINELGQKISDISETCRPLVVANVAAAVLAGIYRDRPEVARDMLDYYLSTGQGVQVTKVPVN